MANNRGYSPRTDRFGNPYMVVSCKHNKKNADFNQGYIELGGKLYKFEVSEAKKDGVAYWVRVTRVNQNRQQNSM